MSRWAMTRRIWVIAVDCPPPCRRNAGCSVERRGEATARLANERIAGPAAGQLADDQHPHVVVRQPCEQQVERLLVLARVELDERVAALARRGQANPGPETVGL